MEKNRIVDLKTILSLLVVCVMTVSSYAQTVIGAGDVPLKEKGEETDAQNLDMATIRCYYYFTQKKKTDDKEFVRQDTLTLDIGSRMSRYYDEAKLKRDSLFGGLDRIDPATIKSISVLKGENASELDHFLGDVTETNFTDGTTEQIYKNREEGLMTIIDYETTPKDPNKYKCEDPVGVLPWKITTDTATVLGYHCQKATLDFRGRSYYAWFAPEIPGNDGPWKFSGLPGLILRVNDTENLFAFECIGLQYLPEPYAIVIPKGRYMKCDRKTLADKMKNRQSMKIGINAGNVVIASKQADGTLKTLELK